MKATSKLISVVLILAMCLSLFTVSAFAAGQTIIIGGNVADEGGGSAGAVYGDTYVGSGADEAEVSTASVEAAAPAASEPAGPAQVKDEADLVAAAAKGGEISLENDIVVSQSLVFNSAATLLLNGKTLTFANSGAAQPVAIQGNAPVAVKNGNVVVSGNSVTAENGAVTTSGFQSVASNVTFQNVNVSFNAPAEWSIFGSGVGLVYGSYNRDVSAWVNSDNFDIAENNGVFAIVDKAPVEAAPVSEEPAPVAEEPAAAEPAAEVEEPVAEPEQSAAEEPAAEEPVAEVEEPVAEPEEPATELEEPATEPEEPAAEEPAAEEPAEEEPATEPEEPAAEPEEPATEPEEPAAEEPAAEEPAEEEPATEPEEIAPVDEQPVDETPVDVVEEKEKTYEEEVRVSEEEEANTDGVVTLTGVDEVSGAVVTVSGKNLPKDLTVVVKPLSTGIIGGLGEGERALLALDITLVDAEGNEYEPKNDPDVGAVSVQIKAAALGNLEEDETLTLYHIVDNEVQTVGSAEQGADDALDFATGSFSPFVITATTGKGTAKTGSEGEVHKKVIKITNQSGDIYVKGGSGIQFKIEGGATPESISIIDPDDVSSGNVNVYKAGYLIYGTDYSLSNDPEKKPNADPVTVTILDSAVANAPVGKWAVVFWFKDTTDSGSTRVYMVQYVTIVPKAEIKAISPLDEDGNFYFEKCDYEPVEIYITADLESFSIVDKSGKTVVNYNVNTNKSKVSVNTKDYKNKTYNASEMFTVSDYIATDAVGHDFIAGKTLKLTKSLIEKLDFGEYTINVSQKNQKATPDNAASESFKLTLVPGIAVADGLNDYIKGSNVWIKFVACEPIDYDDDGTLAIWIGGQKISHDYYSISNDHKTLWIYRNLLDQLRSNNSYTLTARLWKYDSTGAKQTFYPATAQFNILAAGSTSYKSPKTGDNSNIALWAAVLVLSGGAVVALVPKKKKIGK